MSQGLVNPPVKTVLYSSSMIYNLRVNPFLKKYLQFYNSHSNKTRKNTQYKVLIQLVPF